MSVDSTSSSRFFGRKTVKSTVSQPEHSPFSRYSLKLRPSKPVLNNRTMSVSEENSDDILTDLSSLPYMPHKQDLNRRVRRFSELKPNLIQAIPESNTDRDRRNSTPHLNFSSLLPNHFRSHKHAYKTTPRDEANSSFDSSDNSYSSSFNDTMTMKAEPFSSSKKNFNGSRTNLSISSELSSPIYPEEPLSSLFTLDTSQQEPQSAETLMLQLNTPICVARIYRDDFFEHFHTNYAGELQDEGLFIASIRCVSTPACQARAIIRTARRNYNVSVPWDEITEENILGVLFRKAHLSGIQSSRPIGNPKANEKLYAFDKLNDERQNCKIGLISQRLDQRDEGEIFNNDHISTEMIDFLDILADRVRLKGFEKYRGDLDIKNDLHGEHSYYTEYNNREIMFNVAPMVPSTNTTGPCVKRKGLVGNAFVCIVFQEPNTEFLPDIISGKVTQIYITVQPVQVNEQSYYKVRIWHRNDLTSIIDPPGGIYESDKSFRDYFLTLLLNAINVAIESPSLRFCITEQRQRLKQEDMKKLVENLSMGQLFDTTTDINNGHAYVEHRSISRTDSVMNSAVENNHPDSGRISPTPPKKRTLSKILSVFTGRSGSISTISSASNNDLSANTSSVSESSRTGTSSSKESMKRASSVKHRPAPSPPVQTRAPVSYKYSVPPKSPGVINDNPPLQNHFLNVAPLEEALRSRSNTSPDDQGDLTTRRPLSSVSTASKEISDASSIGDYSDDDDDSEDERYEHRPTLTEPSLIPASSSNTNL